MAKHLPVGGSTAERTINCPAWLSRAKDVPASPSTASAKRGNLLHDAMELHYMTDKPFADMVGELKFDDVVLTEEHLEVLHIAKGEVEAIFDHHDAVEWICEPFVELQKDYIGGSIDMIWLSEDGKTAGILDYKFGRKPVNAENNSQLLFYAMCAMADPKTADMFEGVEKIVCTIVQPFAKNHGSDWTTTPVEVNRFSSKLMKALTQTHACPGNHCFYCPAQITCPEKRAQAESIMVLDKEQAATCAATLDLVDELEQWIGQVRDLAKNAAEKGAVIPGRKLVWKKKNRKLKPDAPDKLADFGDAVYDKKLKGIGQLEKLVGKAAFADLDLVETPEPTEKELVLESDKREAVIPESAGNALKGLAKKSVNG